MTIRALGASTPQSPAVDPAPAGLSASTAGPDQPAVPAPSGEAASLNLDHLAQAIGLDPDEVLRRLANGRGLGDRLSATAETGYGSTVGGMIRGGILVDEYA